MPTIRIGDNSYKVPDTMAGTSRYLRKKLKCPGPNENSRSFTFQPYVLYPNHLPVLHTLPENRGVRGRGPTHTLSLVLVSGTKSRNFIKMPPANPCQI